MTGADAMVAKGRWRAHQWLVLRRLSQLSILGLFLLGPLAGVWIVKGNLTSSYTLNFLPLSDPYILLQSLLTQDMYLAGAFVLLICALTMVGSIISDILLALIDPRIRLE